MTYEQMKGALSSMLLIWSRLERCLREEVVRAGGSLPKNAHGVSTTLRGWEMMVAEAATASTFHAMLATCVSDRIRELAKVRNGLCHGLRGFSGTYAGIPASATWKLNGEEHTITWEELEEQLSWISRIERAIGILSAHPKGGPGCRLLDNDENRAWWRSEFSLDLPDA